MLQDTLADALSTIKNAEKAGKKECLINASKLIKEVLNVLRVHGYIDSFEFINDGKSGKFHVSLKGKIIEMNVIKPRFSVKVDKFEKWEKRFLPAKGVGLLVMSTSKGVMDHKKANEIHVGGKLLAYVY
jgi:small subunit ribosomal protein S8